MKKQLFFPDSSNMTPVTPLLQLPNTFRVFYGSFITLHRIQQQAIEPVLANRDIILQSATGSGKTEAVLAPCLERIISENSNTANKKISALYIVPTRALALDIRRRFAALLKDRLGIRLAIRTGDMKSGTNSRPDIILTTPESLDVMLGSSNSDLQRFLLRVRTIIIDEVHPLVNQYRGQHLSWLMHRLERRTRTRLQRIALSATIADPDAVCSFLQFRPDYVLLTDDVRRQIHPRLIHLKDDENELISLVTDLSHEWRYQKILIFANSRGRCDKIFGLLNNQGAFQGKVLLHYSNLNTRERQVVEQQFRKQSRAICVATSTLELGIDVGDVDAVLLFEPPDSVSAFLQRIGRANRRSDTIHFWGICQGERAGEQLLRFLALLALAEEGKVESALSGTMASVLSQQIISCLYEKKQLNLAALIDLFAAHWQGQSDIPIEESEQNSEQEIELELEQIFASLIQKKWLKKSKTTGLYKGGYQYWQALLEYKIWSNFPPNEELYQLLVKDEAVADIPLSVVKQIESGDRVILAGRRLLITRIDNKNDKRVLAEPASTVDDKEIAWLGKGSHVSFEVAQAMGKVLKSEKIPDLFARSRELLRLELAKDRRAVLLDNGIEVVRLENGSLQYRTFIGAMGNLILAISAKHFFAGLEKEDREDISVISDEIGLICSHQIKFEQLALPVTEDDFSSWIRSHFKMMAAMFSMNSFCYTLPRELLCLELTGFISDHRLLDFFKRCANSTSAIVKGDPGGLSRLPLITAKKMVQEIPCHAEPLLEAAKKHLPDTHAHLFHPDGVRQPKALTGTMIGEYFRHQQCERWLSMQFFQTQVQPEKGMADKNDAEISLLRLAQGIAFEDKIIAHLQQQNTIFRNFSARNDQAQKHSLTARFAETATCFEQIETLENPGNCYIVQPVLHVDDVLQVSAQDQSSQDQSSQGQIAGVGIPDLIQLCPGEGEDTNSIALQVGDIKSSHQPRYYQKWQVAFYGWLLQQIIQQNIPQRNNNTRLTVQDKGFILTPCPEELARRHVFDLKPYFASMDAVIRNIERVLKVQPWQSCWQLQMHCISCRGFPCCYQEALLEEDVQFVPGISRGGIAKMRSLGVRTVQQELGREERDSFSFSQKKALLDAMTALRTNTILLRREMTTDLFPANIASIFVVHLIVDPVTKDMQTIGLSIHSSGQKQKSILFKREAGETPEQKDSLWEDFSDCLSRLWQDEINNTIDKNRVPHLLLFGQSTRLGLLHQAEQRHDNQMMALLSSGENCHYTDMRQLLSRHFSFPLPGTMTLYGLNRILQLMPAIELAQPASLLHDDRFTEIDVSLICELIFKLWQWCLPHLKSQEQRNQYHPDQYHLHQQKHPGLSQACLEFIERERVYQQRDMAALMELTLEERVVRFRAVGPLACTGTSLDEEGRFVYLFSKTPSRAEEDDQMPQPAKFRAGDFLKLVPVGVTDLQSGLPVIMAGFNSQTGAISIYLRKKSNRINREITWSLEEDGEDYLSAKLRTAVQQAFTGDNLQISNLFNGTFTHKREQLQDDNWLANWLHSEAAPARLNPSQQQALQLPFQYALSLISGPPGTGKTYLLGWILIALFRQAQHRGTGLRIAVSALTHKAIDQVLTKLTSLVNSHELADFPVRCMKLGTWEGDEFDPDNPKNLAMQVEPCTKTELFSNPYIVVGATGYGLYNMLHKKDSNSSQQKTFDWIIFDEASQMLIPQALLSLLHGKGNFLFLGDVCQLPPIIRSANIIPANIIQEGEDGDEDSFAAQTRSSLLEVLLKRYPQQNHLLDITYRMNDAICHFPSMTWYKNKLIPAPETAVRRLLLPSPTKNDLIDTIIDPQKPVVLVEVSLQESARESLHDWSRETELEADLLASTCHRLLDEYGLDSRQVAIISPHRVQNNRIAATLARLLGHDELPVIDTVERMQGAERDVILFGFGCSDPDQIFSDFLNNPNRFNVVLTRARHKIIIVGSRLFFESVASTEQQLQANVCFKEFVSYCRENGCYFECSGMG